jgi:hypothetical protein
MSPESDLTWIQVRWILGLISPEDLPRIATELLCADIESRFFVELAGLSRTEGGAAALFEQALDELGCGAMEPTDALKLYAKAVFALILASKTSPLEGARRIGKRNYNVGLLGWHDRDPFICAVSEAESRPEDRQFF